MSDNDFRRLETMLDAARELPPPTRTSPAGSDIKPTKISGVPVSRILDSFDNFDMAKNPGMHAAYLRCYLVAQGQEWCAFLTGGYGTGKTHLAIAAMARYGMLRSYFWKVPDYLEWLREKAFNDGYALDELTRSYRQDPFLLVLDDLGAENPTDWVHEQLYRVLDSRYDLRLPTIITTNQPQDRIDPRILSRYAEGIVVCKGADVRRAR